MNVPLYTAIDKITSPEDFSQIIWKNHLLLHEGTGDI